jgi:hypothetical protein
MLLLPLALLPSCLLSAIATQRLSREREKMEAKRTGRNYEATKLLTGGILIILTMLPSLSTAQENHKGAAICNQIAIEVNTVIDWTQTLCIAARGKQPGAYSFIVTSTQPVFSAEASKKAWLLMAVAFAGKNLNESPSVKAEELWLSDANLVKNRTAYILPARVAKLLQRQVKSDKITLDGMYSEVSKNLGRRAFSDKEWEQHK